MQESSTLSPSLCVSLAGLSRLLVSNASELGNLFDPLGKLTLREAVCLLQLLASDRAFQESWIIPLLERAEPEKDWYVARRHDVPAGLSLQVFVWPPGSRTQIHDHSSWGTFFCVVGSVLEERYARLDDGFIPEYGRLNKIWQRMWRIEDGISTVLPYEGGIHRVGNPGTETAISAHIYGPPIGEIDGRDYDPSRDYICDRRDGR